MLSLVIFQLDGMGPLGSFGSRQGLWGPGPYDKSSPGYCNTFIQKLYEGLKVATYRTKTSNFTRIIHLNWLAKFELNGPEFPGRQYIVNYCCARVLLYAEDAKRKWNWRIKAFLSPLFHWWDFDWGGAGPCFPPGYTYGTLAMIARSWLFCYDMLGYYITKPYLFFLH